MSESSATYSHRLRHSTMRSSSRGSGRAIPIPLEPLNPGHRMDPQERLFLEAAERGDKHTMIRCLQGPNPVNVNSTNILGRSAIQIAVDNENVEIVELLLKQDGVKIGDAVLYAIREGVYRIVEMLIDHPSITREMLGNDWCRYKLSGEESNDYSPDISPVILAAHCNQFEILQLLLSRGARIERPHALNCTCQKCRKEVRDDSLRHSLLRIHTYRALASPAWISLTSPDPVLTAFKLSWELDKLAMRENEFKDTYAELSDRCKKYSCDLLEQCRSTEEVIAVLNKEMFSDSEDEICDVDYDDLTLGRLKLALKYEQKQFVAHPHSQQLLASIWYEGLPGWRKRNFVAKVVIVVGLIAVMPLMAAYYLILPRSKLGKLIRTPFMKFMYHSASFGVFLFLLILASTNVSSGSGQKHRQKMRGPPPTVLEWLIVFYVSGFIWSECKQLWEEGLKAYVRQWWNWLDFIMLSLYLCTFSLRIVAYCQSQNEIVYGPQIMSRQDWPEADPTLVSEGVFAIANVFSFARIIYLFQANPALGPLQISLGCMLIDIGKFMFIFFLVLISFACGLNQLYYYYSSTEAGIEQVTLPVYGAHNTTSNQTQPIVLREIEEYYNAFDPLNISCITLFWTIFGLITLQTLDDNLCFVEWFGRLLFGLYNVAVKVMLLNMLIAMMAKSFHSIVDHADREWKFARSKLWMGYFDEGSTLPAPFNLIISPKSVYYLLCWCKTQVHECMWQGRMEQPRSHSKELTDGTIKSSDQDISGVSEPSGCNHTHQASSTSPDSDIDTVIANYQAEVKTEPETRNNGDAGSSLTSPRPDRPRYQDVMRRLVSRFIHQWKKQMRQDGVNEDDLLEIKQDISSLRYELREDRKRESARTMGHIDNLKRDILRSLRSTSGHGPPPPAPGWGESGDVPVSQPGSGTGNFLTQSELECLKREIVSSLRGELKDLAREISVGGAPGGSSGGPTRGSPATAAHHPSLPPLNSELYHTHLYTQL